jgi:predicted dehydrogenase
LHYAIAKQALEHGLHVFLEKPMTLDMEKGAELIKLAMDKGVILMVGHVLRFMPPYMKLKQWIDNGEFGDLKFLSVSRFSGVPSWGQWKEKQKAFGSTGGALFDLLIHDIDFVQYVLGIPDRIESFYLPGALSEHDYIRARWNYDERDLVVMVEGGDIYHSNFPFHAEYSAKFEHASVHYTTFKPDIIHVATHTEMKELDAGEADMGFFNETEYFAQCVENREAPVRCLPESALQTIEICYKHLR